MEKGKEIKLIEHLWAEENLKKKTNIRRVHDKNNGIGYQLTWGKGVGTIIRIQWKGFVSTDG